MLASSQAINRCCIILQFFQKHCSNSGITVGVANAFRSCTSDQKGSESLLIYGFLFFKDIHDLPTYRIHSRCKAQGVK